MYKFFEGLLSNFKVSAWFNASVVQWFNATLVPWYLADQKVPCLAGSGSKAFQQQSINTLTSKHNLMCLASHSIYT